MPYIKDVRWDKTAGAVFLGRNGEFVCTGAEVYTYRRVNQGNGVQLTPITGKGDRGRCAIQIPASKLKEVIAALQAAAEDLGLNP